jgi:hypothetical protein
MAHIRPAKCPRCGSARVAAIIPNPPAAHSRLFEDLKARRAVLAKRAPTGNDPRWCCLKCRLEWGHPRGLSGSSASQNDLA